MAKRNRLRPTPMEAMRKWRDHLDMTRQSVVDKINERFPDRDPPTTQATLAKWEEGTTALTVEMLLVISEIYGVPPAGLLKFRGDAREAKWHSRIDEALDILTPESIEHWLDMISVLEKRNPA